MSKATVTSIKPSQRRVDLELLMTAAQFASSDEARGVICSVAVIGDHSYYVGCNTYVLGVVSPAVEPAATMVHNVQQANVSEALLVPAGVIKSAHKAARSMKRDFIAADIVTPDANNVGFEVCGHAGAQTFRDRTYIGEYPRISGLMSADQPFPPEAVSFSMEYFRTIDAALKLLGSEHITYFGHKQGNDKYGDPLKAGYWYASSDRGSLLVLWMPVRTSRSWDGAK